MSKNIIEVSQENFVELVIKGSEKLPVVVDFCAPWCSPCKQLTPILEKTATSFQEKIILAKINIDENQSIQHKCKSNPSQWCMLSLMVKSLTVFKVI